MTLEFGPLGAARRQQREQMQQRQQTSAASSPSALADARGDARFGSGRGRPPGALRGSLAHREGAARCPLGVLTQGLRVSAPPW